MFAITDIKGAIFDIDGTLLDSMHVWDDLCSKYLKSIGVDPEASIDAIVAEMTINECADYVIERYGLDISREEFSDGVSGIIADFYTNEVLLKPGARELVTRMRSENIPMILVTTGDRTLSVNALTRCGIFDCFDALLTCNEYDTTKDSPDIFNKALEMIRQIAGQEDIVSSEIFVFEDAIKAIRTVKEEGYRVVGIRDDSGYKSWNEIEKLADITVDSLEEIVLDKEAVSADAKYICPCCKKHFFTCKASYEICPVCKWEDDPVQRKDELFAGGANELCLDEYRKQYMKSEEEYNNLFLAEDI